MKFSLTKNPESDLFINNPNITKLEQVSRGSRIPWLVSLPSESKLLTPNFNLNAINIKYSKFLTFITGE